MTTTLTPAPDATKAALAARLARLAKMAPLEGAWFEALCWRHIEDEVLAGRRAPRAVDVEHRLRCRLAAGDVPATMKEDDLRRAIRQVEEALYPGLT
jgi:hypothetical protein